ncbi:MAG TPA: SCO family protein [Fimbriimonas sp.]|nr:SCO family protein [Fimbriimonas sp.]
MVIGAVLSTAVGALGQDSQSSLTKQMGLDQKLGAYTPKDATFKDESGKVVKFGDYFKSGRPVLLVPIFFTCRTMCVNIADALVGTLAKATRTHTLKPGVDFEVVMLSINHKETPELARGKKMEIFNMLTPPKGGATDEQWRAEAEAGWHMLTGTEENVRAITNAVGFKFSYDHKKDLINHPSASMILTPTGQVSSYLVGPTFPTTVLKTDLTAAANGEIGAAVDQSFMFGCIRLDKAGKYTPVVENIVRLACVVTIILVAGFIFSMILMERRKAHLQGGAVLR